MLAGVKQQLVEALRSGKYRQIRGTYHDGRGGHCVLGVAEHIGIVNEIDWVAQTIIICMNDGQALTFDQIADQIEAGILGVSEKPPAEWRKPPAEWAELAAIGQFAAKKTIDATGSNPDGNNPPSPAVIYIYPTRPVLSGAVGVCVEA